MFKSFFYIKLFYFIKHKIYIFEKKLIPTNITTIKNVSFLNI